MVAMSESESTLRMPALFVGHGNPMNALSRNSYTEAWSRLGRSIPKPEAILAISAHWYVPYAAVTSNEHPPTIHDFGGFPQQLYGVKYPAPGNPALAQRVAGLLEPHTEVKQDDDWGLDHGTWSVLVHMFPDADIPVVQLSLDATRPPEFHYALARYLMPLRDEGVLILGSGNIVHNLRAYAWGKGDVSPFPWAVSFENRIRQSLLSGDDESLVDYPELSEEALMSAPTPDHYLPFIYALGLRGADESVSFPVEGIEGGSISMLSVQFG